MSVPELRVGQGFDVHPFSDDPARKLVLGGVVFADSPGLRGHSDADAVAHAITDALLLSGDEDVRIGVQIAQSFGVRVHLLGIEPIRSSLSDLLMQEADTTTEWSADTIRKFLDYVPDDLPAKMPRLREAGASHEAVEKLDEVIGAIVVSLSAGDIASLQLFWESHKGLPSDYDRPLLGKCKAAMARNLDPHEKTAMRTKFVNLVRGRIEEQK